MSLSWSFRWPPPRWAHGGNVIGGSRHRAADSELVHSLASNEYSGRTLAWDETLEKKVRSLTNDQILAAMRKAIDPAKISTVVSGDFAKVKRTGALETEGGTAK